jgi:hypothetical protein
VNHHHLILMRMSVLTSKNYKKLSLYLTHSLYIYHHLPIYFSISPYYILSYTVLFSVHLSSYHILVPFSYIFLHLFTLCCYFLFYKPIMFINYYYRLFILFSLFRYLYNLIYIHILIFSFSIIDFIFLDVISSDKSS